MCEYVARIALIRHTESRNLLGKVRKSGKFDMKMKEKALKV